VNIPEAALPEASAPTVTELDPLLAKLPLAPLKGAVKVIGVATPDVNGQPSVFASVTWKGVAKPLFSGAVCGVPETIWSVFGGLDAGHVWSAAVAAS